MKHLMVSPPNHRNHMEHNAHVIHLITTTPLRKENTLATAKIYELTVTHERNDLNPKESVTATYEGTWRRLLISFMRTFSTPPVDSSLS